jgi:DNA-binding beta-propeller fold protein YncE
MRLFTMNSGQSRARMVKAGAVFVAVALIAGCGNNYRPVVTPVGPAGPASQPYSYAVVVSSTSATTPGVATIVDYSGDTVMAEAPIGPGPTSFTIDSFGGTGYTVDSDGTITNFPVSTSLQEKLIFYTTLPSTAKVVNLYTPSLGMWAADLDGNVADVFASTPQTFVRAIPVAPTPVSVVSNGQSSAQRNLVLSQNFTDPTGVACNTAPTAAPLNGVVTPIETASNAADPAIGLDPFNPTNTAGGSKNALCPVYGVVSADDRRLFVLNRGSDTISVINVQNNSLDQCEPFIGQSGQLVTCHPLLPLSLTAVNALTAASKATGITGVPAAPPNGTANMGNVAGPVYAEYNTATSQLVVANYDGGTISVIDVSLDLYGNDSPTFGTTYTIKVGSNPASVTALFDGSRAYTANQADNGTGNGSVTIVNLASHTVEKTLTVVGHPRTVASIQNSLYGKVYAASPDSPYLTVIDTLTDLVGTTVLVEGNIVDVRVTTQNGSSGNANTISRIPGFGEPCNLPPGSAALPVPLTQAACQTIP